MDENARAEWLAVAWATLKHLPADLLRIGCAEARRTCDHPAKIVPCIVAETEDSLRRRREMAREAPPAQAPPERRIEQPMSPEQVEEMNALMARVGASTRYRPDGSRYEAERETGKPRNTGPLRRPTRQDYIELGVDPAILDKLDLPHTTTGAG